MSDQTPPPNVPSGQGPPSPVPGNAPSVSAPSGQGSTTTPVPPAKTSRLQAFMVRWLKRLGILAVLIIIGLVVAEHETSKPEFCSSCHIMEPYYQSWKADVHGGKLEIACVECHYAPGERTTIKAKMRGLSQLASYFSGRYGKGRPRAFVDNLSCMTAKCHGDNRFMDKEITMGTVRFSHARHLHPDGKKDQAAKNELDALGQMLLMDLGKERFLELEQLAQQAIHAQELHPLMLKLVSDVPKKIDPGILKRFAQIQHRDVRVDQLHNMQCTNCHSYGAAHPVVPGQEMAHHFSVRTTSCITCHFNNESFNTGTTTCLTCHKLPSKEIMVHEALNPHQEGKLKTPELAKKTISIDHETMVKRNVNCYSCHADVAIKNIRVSRRDCDRCHDQPSYFKDWKEPLALDQVKRYHASHVPEQRAKCLDCHSEIQHQLIRKDTAMGDPSFLASAIGKCTQCHPNHHAEQIQLLSGVGGKGVPKGSPNLMFGSRTNCFGCHQEQVVKKHGGVSRTGTVSGCISCHGDTHKNTYEKWKLGIELTLEEAQKAFDLATNRLAAAKELAPATRQKAAALLKSCEEDLLLLRRGNAVHNVNYSLDLLDSVTSRSQQVLALIAKGQK